MNPKIFYTAIVFMLITIASNIPANGADPGPVPQVPVLRCSSTEIVNGDTLILEIDARKMQYPIFNIRVEYKQKDIPVFPHPRKIDEIYYCIIGISFYSKAGKYMVNVKWADQNGFHEQKSHFTIRKGNYKTENINQINSRTMNPSKEDLLRAKKESGEVKNAYSLSTPNIQWFELFQIPVNSKITSPYGTKRLLNGKLKRYHSGIDLRAATGTPIYASNSGTVKLAQNLFFSGNLVIIDHGTGIFTNYMHLSEISVLPGRRVKRGDQIGLAGATGRVNGPHLHWGVKIHGANVNPIQFLNIFERYFTPNN